MIGGYRLIVCIWPWGDDIVVK